MYGKSNSNRSTMGHIANLNQIRNIMINWQCHSFWLLPAIAKASGIAIFFLVSGLSSFSPSLSML
jgi:hypothetical protein